MYPTTFGRFAEPQAVATHFHLRTGDVVADFGAGSGHYMKALSTAVGKEGKVYLCEIQRSLVDALDIKAREQRLTNIRPIWCDLEAPNGIKLKDGELDAGLLSNTLFQFTNKEVALTEIARVMRKGAKLFIIDWSESFGGLGPQSAQIIREDEAKALITRTGFTFDRSFPAGDHHYGIACRKQ